MSGITQKLWIIVPGIFWKHILSQNGYKNAKKWVKMGQKWAEMSKKHQNRHIIITQNHIIWVGLLAQSVFDNFFWPQAVLGVVLEAESGSKRIFQKFWKIGLIRLFFGQKTLFSWYSCSYLQLWWVISSASCVTRYN